MHHDIMNHIQFVMPYNLVKSYWFCLNRIYLQMAISNNYYRLRKFSTIESVFNDIDNHLWSCFWILDVLYDALLEQLNSLVQLGVIYFVSILTRNNRIICHNLGGNSVVSVLSIPWFAKNFKVKIEMFYTGSPNLSP